MESVYITGIIVFGIMFIVWAFRDRITELFFGVSEEQGKRKGVFKATAAHPQRKPKGGKKSGKSYAVDISGNTRRLNRCFGEVKKGESPTKRLAKLYPFS
jgi:hypothetical protein